MIKSDWTLWADRAQPPLRGEAASMPVAHQGVLQALRVAFQQPCGDLPEDMRALLAKLN
jgi:hypothetical protein